MSQSLIKGSDSDSKPTRATFVDGSSNLVLGRDEVCGERSNKVGRQLLELVRRHDRFCHSRRSIWSNYVGEDVLGLAFERQGVPRKMIETDEKPRRRRQVRELKLT